MPIYTYRCKNCGVQFDQQQKFSDAPLTRCPECSKKTLQKVYQPVGIVFKGSGFYSTDNRSPSGAGHASSKAKNNEGKNGSSEGSSGDTSSHESSSHGSSSHESSSHGSSSRESSSHESSSHESSSRESSSESSAKKVDKDKD
jgi:putative FmdB family regulatory protein